MLFQHIILLLVGLISAFNHDPFSGPNIAANQTTSQTPDCREPYCLSSLAVDELNNTCFQSYVRSNFVSTWTVKFKRSYSITGIRIFSLTIGNITNSPLLVFGTAESLTVNDSSIFNKQLNRGLVYNHVDIVFNSSVQVSGITLYVKTSTFYFCEVQVFSAYCDAVVNFTNGGVIVYNFSGDNFHRSGNYYQNTAGTIIEFSCHPDYLLRGPMRIQCLPSGEYNMTNPTCVKAICPVVPNIQNGIVEIVGNSGRTDWKKNTIGTVLQFSCNMGFHIAGPSFVKCLESGSYNDSTNNTLCLKNFCPVVPNIHNGTVEIVGNSGRTDWQKNTIGTVLQFTCNMGFQIAGPSFVKCLESGRYNDSTNSTSCLMLRCQPFTIYKGNITYSNSLYEGSTANITCEKGYKINGDSSLTCSDKQTWSGIPPTCKLIHCLIPILPGGKYMISDSLTGCQQTSNLGIPYKCEIYPECNEGYGIWNRQTRQCYDLGTWTYIKYEPFCQKMCIVPLQRHGNYYYLNGSVVNTTYIQNGTEIMLKCREGYLTLGHSNITCQTGSGEWLGNMANCTEIVCNYTNNETALNGVYRRLMGDDFTSGTLSFNETVNLNCELGYKVLSGSLSRTCKTDGTLSGTAAKCERVTCPPLPLVDELSYQYSDNNGTSGFPYNTTVYVSCNKGISKNGIHVQRCLDKGSWDGLSPTCIPTCSLPLVQYGSLSKGTEMVQPNETTFTNGTRLLIICNDGYEFNVSEVTCLETHNWSDNPLCYSIVAGQTSKKTAVIGGAVGSVLFIIALAVTLIVLKHRGILSIPGKKTMQRRPLVRRTTKTDGTESNRAYTEIQDIELRDKSEDVPVTSRQLQPNIGVWSNYEVEQPKNAYYKFGSVEAETIPKTAILIKDLSDLVFTGKDFQTEFERFPVGLHGEHSVALKSQNKGKSRYKNLYAYDESRVILETDTSESDYINACYVHGFQRERAYIASQGPVTEIFIDFWRMIWQTNCKKIVMLTKLVELAKTKCDQYWPEEGTKVYGNVSVSKKGVDIFSEFVIRTFIVQKENLPDRTVTQFHFTAWPDKGVPRHASSLVHFRNKVKYTGCSDVAPIVVHCSAGVGRTGTFIALDYLTDQAKCLGYVDVYGCVENLRKQRVNLVQTVEQYMFIHHALVETLMLSTSALPSAKFPEAYQKLLEKHANTGERKLDHDFKMLKRLSPVTQEEQYVSAKLVRNRKKNRYLNILPVDEFMPRLSAGTEEYVNAVLLPSYKEKKAFIITQTPLETTIESFWKLAWEHNVHTIVMMNNLEEMQIREIYWPKEGDNISFAEFQVLNEGATLEDQHNVLSMRLQSQSERREIRLIQCGGWPSSANLPDSPKILLSLLEIVQSWQQQTENQPILVHCMNGAEKSGLYCVVSAVIERMKIEQDVAISQVIQEMRNVREQLISSVDQYQFCHEVVLAYIQQNEMYSNFSL